MIFITDRLEEVMLGSYLQIQRWFHRKGLMILILGTCLLFSDSMTQEGMGDEFAQQIIITIGEERLTAAMKDSKTSRAFIDLLPLHLTLEDYSGTEKISDLPERLDTSDAPPGSDPAAGDIAYYAPWGNLAIFYKDFRFSQGLVILGHIQGDLAPLAGPGPIQVKIERID